jgi:hypothetical protein
VRLATAFVVLLAGAVLIPHAGLCGVLDTDFNGDGRQDVTIHDRQAGSWFVGRSTGAQFVIEQFVSSFGDRGGDRERVFVADFTGDGRADIAIHDWTTGDWYIGRSTGDHLAVERWASGFGNRPDAEEVLIGDFTGDGKADIAIHDTQSGAWFVGVSTGSSFAIQRWASGFGTQGSGVEEVVVGDFTGDGRADIAIHNTQTGDWHVGVSTGGQFRIERWASGFGNRGTGLEEIFVGDFTGDGRADVVVHDVQRGDWYVGRSTGVGLVIERWATGFGNQGTAIEQVFVGDFTGDNRTDIAIHNSATGTWHIGRSTGSSFVIERWANGFGNRGRSIEEVFVADFTGDGKEDVALHDKERGDWYVGRSTGQAFSIERWATGFGNRGDTVEEVLGGARRQRQVPSFPSLVGSYVGDGTLTQAGCTDREDNGTFRFATLVQPSVQAGSTFSGSAWLSRLGPGVIILTEVRFQGSTNQSGEVVGSFSFTTSANASTTDTGGGVFTGTLHDRTFSFSFSGSGNSCRFQGSTSTTLGPDPTPNVQGTYFGSITFRQSNCADPSLNGTFIASGSITFSGQSGSVFGGSGRLTNAFGVITIPSLRGVVAPTGELGGVASTVSTGNLLATGASAFIGGISGNRLTADFSGHAGSCAITGSLVAFR